MGQRKLLTVRARALATIALGILLAGPPAAQAHPRHCEKPPERVLRSGGLQLTELGTIGSLTGAVSAPGEPGRVYLVGLHGLVWVMENGAVRQEPFLDLSAEVSPTVDIAENERGMLSLAFAPDYQTSRRFYVYTTTANGDGSVLEFHSTPDGYAADPATRREVLHIPHSWAGRHYGGQVAFGPNGRLYVSNGDANRPGWAQKRRLYGSVISIDPLRPDAGRRWIAKGLRNPYRFTFDPFDRSLVIGDVGEALYDEIDVIAPGRRRTVNFGWPYREGPKVHRKRRLRRYGRPVLAYSHRIGTAVIGGVVMSDGRLPGYRGRYLYGDFCDGFVAVADLHRKRPTTRMSGLVVPGLTTFGEDAEHRVYLGTAYGQLYRLDPVATAP